MGEGAHPPFDPAAARHSCPASAPHPVAAIIEAGNHIAQVSDGRLRRRSAEELVREVMKALDGDSPWVPIEAPSLTDVRVWLNGFPEMAMREIGLGDVSIIDAWHRSRRRIPGRRVRIWSLDRHLSSYDA